MPYVDRDGSNNVVGVYANAQRKGQEFLPPNDAAVTAYLNPVLPDVANFLIDLYGTVFGGSFATVDTVLKASPSFAQLQTQLEAGNWAAATGIILYAQSVSAITGPQYAAIKTAATARNIPVTLP